jgi:hypothetical protein
MAIFDLTAGAHVLAGCVIVWDEPPRRQLMGLVVREAGGQVWGRLRLRTEGDEANPGFAAALRTYQPADAEAEAPKED